MANKVIKRYISPANNGKPAQTINQLLEELNDVVLEHMLWDSTLNNKPAKGRKEVRITITVEAV